MTEEQSLKYIGETEKNLARFREGELDEWITTADAAKISGYHVEYLRELIRESKIEGRKFGIVWQVNSSSLLSFLKQAETMGDRRFGPKSSTQKS